MSYILAAKRPRHWRDKWNPEVLKAELRKKDRSLRAILRDISTKSVGWQGLYNDCRAWRRVDSSLDQLIKEHSRDVSGKTHAGGRNRIDSDPEKNDWMIDFAAEYLKTRNKVKAAAVTPYKPASILTMLDEKKTDYNPKFAAIVDGCDKMLLEKVYEVAYQALDDAVAQAIGPKDRAWIALNIAKVAKGTTWNQQKLDVNMTGSIKFEAARAKVTGELVAEQRQHFEKYRAKLLPSGDREAIDVEVLEPVKEEV